MHIKEITWQQTIPIRHKVLWPDKPPEFCHIEDDNDGWHFGYYVGDDLVGVASVYPSGSVTGNDARLRKFATLASSQGKGIGTKLLNHIILTLKNRGITLFWCDARETATGFYERFGLHKQGSRFFKSTVPYFKMSVELTRL
ncbi:MAG: GNAT family N-acetyltransferase [Algicola sp.]|nr:GNAT family N-acetyltransferase [Algicola sp.]